MPFDRQRLPLLAGLRWFWYTSTLKPNSDTSCLGLRLPPQKDTQSTTTPNARFSVNLPVPDRSCLGGRASACSDSVFHFDMPSVVPKTPELRYPIPTGIETASRQQSHGSKYTTWAGVVAMRCSTEGVPRFGFQMIQLLWILDLDGLQPIAMASNQLAMASNLMQLRYCSKDTMHFSLMLAPGFAFQTKRAWIGN